MKSNNNTILQNVALLIGLLAIIIVMPLSMIWAFNTLFPIYAIPYNFYNWLAVVILNLFLNRPFYLKN